MKTRFKLTVLTILLLNEINPLKYNGISSICHSYKNLIDMDKNSNKCPPDYKYDPIIKFTDDSLTNIQKETILTKCCRKMFCIDFHMEIEPKTNSDCLEKEKITHVTGLVCCKGEKSCKDLGYIDTGDFGKCDSKKNYYNIHVEEHGVKCCILDKNDPYKEKNSSSNSEEKEVSENEEESEEESKENDESKSEIEDDIDENSFSKVFV